MRRELCRLTCCLPVHPPVRRAALLLSLRVSLLVILLPVSRAHAAVPPVLTVRLPDKALVPDVAVDARGTIHVVYGLGDHALYVRSADNGKTFSEPVRINTEGKVQLTMGERGPKIALGKDNTIHVVWADRWSPGVKVLARHARSIDGGKTFSPAAALSPMSGIDGLTVAADATGNVLAFWHAFGGEVENTRDAHRLWLARSTDDGATFKAEPLAITGKPELACSMCMMRARIVGGHVLLAFRAADENIRDFWLLKSPVKQNAFVSTRVNADRWIIPNCPMCGPELTLTPAGEPLVAFMTKNRVFWSRADKAAAKFELHVGTPTNQADEIYPTAVANKAGDVVLAWQTGPMAVGKKAQVQWALYGKDGKYKGARGEVGTSTSGTKATLFVGSDDQFYMLTTAQ